MRILLDYRPALRQRTGVGEYVHELARALVTPPVPPDEALMLFTTSFKDRPDPGLQAALPGVVISDHRIPVRALTTAWHHLGWPPVETLCGPVDVVHGQTPVRIPARHAAQVVTIHDLDFLHHPDRARAEMRRDYPKLAGRHARSAHQVVVSSRYAAGEVTRVLAVPPERVSVCPPGAPSWAAAVAARRRGRALGDYVLFVGTVEPRKNVAGLLAAYRLARARDARVPRLVVAGRVTADGRAALGALTSHGLAGQVELRGYVPDAARPDLYASARMLVLPSFEEGFGLPVLEAMACGVPVVVSNRGALPEVAGAAAVPVDPDDPEAIAARMLELLDDAAAERAIAAGMAQASRYQWSDCAAAARRAYQAAIDHAHRR
ncbi:MAG: glycosyltransferase family 1 protein [Acidobacteriota bacterium]